MKIKEGDKLPEAKVLIINMNKEKPKFLDINLLS